jgi:hypothetical protein
MIGMKPSPISFLINFTFTSVTSPTKPRSTMLPSSSVVSFWHTSTLSPGRPLGRALAEATASHTSLFTISSSVFFTTAMVASSVTRRPLTKFAFSPDCSIAFVMALPPPCTTTTLMPQAARNAMS